MISLGQLITKPTEDETLASILSILNQLGFQTTSWQSGSVQLILVRMMARVWSAIGTQIANVAAGGFTTLAAASPELAPYLKLLAQYFYNITPLDAVATQGTFTLTSSAGAPALSVGPGDILFSNQPQGTVGAATFRNTGSVSMGPGSTLQIPVLAEVAGADGNIAPNSTLYLWTPLVGITASNPPLLPSTTWITITGVDEESSDRLLQRCINRWAAIAYSNMDGAYKYWALTALPALTRVSIAGAAGDANVVLYGATASGPLTGPECTVIEDYVNGVTDGIGRRPLNDIFDAQPATTVTTPALSFTAYVTSPYFDTAGATISAALLAYVNALPLGGKVLQGNQGRAVYSDMMDIGIHSPGVRSFQLNITDDVLLSPGQIYLPTITPAVYPVAPGVL